MGSFIVMRYMYWRITSTMPPISDPLGFFFGSILLAAEIYCVCVLVISLTMNVDPLKREPLEREEDDKLPTVDIFIPTYNEDEYILATTIAAAKSMDYPPDKLKVWLLDDGGSDQKCNDKNPEKAQAAQLRRVQLQKLCMEMGAIYLTRKKNLHAKAGNMNEALKVSSGEVVVVFDADHAPFRAFLRETVGHFAKDPRLFLVQTPHVFLNPDPIEKNLRTFDRMPSENEMFYSVTQCGLDKWNGSFFCGSAALLRRSALETVGGFSGITITEDCETALDGMLLAVAANDRDSFDRMWNWTRANLMVRDDQLIAWRWEPGQRPPVADMNNATDGDILVSWALTEAAELWAELSYRVAARRIAVEVGRKTILFKQKPGSLILPAVAGFSAEERSDGPVINLSYYVFPAFARLALVAPEYDWSGLSQAGLDIARQARFGKSQLPTEWISIRDGKVKPATGFPAHFSYNAIRIPLYMAWAGIGDWVHYEPFFNWGVKPKSTTLAIVDVHTNKNVEGFREPGFTAIGHLLSCLPENGNVSRSFLQFQPNQNYYPATLHIMAVVALEMRYPSCVR